MGTAEGPIMGGASTDFQDVKPSTQNDMEISAVTKLVQAGLSKEEIRYIMKGGERPSNQVRRKAYGRNEKENQGYISHIEETHSRDDTMAQRLRQIPGFILDFTQKGRSNKSWDFGIKSDRERALRMVKGKNGIVMLLNPNDTNVHKYDEKKGLEQLKFMMQLCRAQARNGFYFVYEHQGDARSWHTKPILSMLNEKRTQIIKDPDHNIKYMSNAPEIIEALAEKRMVYESKSNDQDCKMSIGMLNQVEVDGRIKRDCIGISMPEMDKIGMYRKTEGALDCQSVIGHSKCSHCSWTGWTNAPSICPKCEEKTEWVEPKSGKAFKENGINVLCLDENSKKVFLSLIHI